MFEKEISDYPWQVHPRLTKQTLRVISISDLEQENHISIIKVGYGPDRSPELIVDCTFQKYITKYRRSEVFLLTEITVSTERTDPDLGGFVLGVKGIMPVGGITIKKKIGNYQGRKDIYKFNQYNKEKSQ